MSSSTVPVSSGRDRTLIFTYGTLKRGFRNHVLTQRLISSGDASFLGEYATLDPLPLVRGPHGVPFLLNLPGAGEHRVSGELYSVTDAGLVHLDELEGITIGHYERLPVRVRRENRDVSDTGCKGSGPDGTRVGSDGVGLKWVGSGHAQDGVGEVVEAEAYYAHRSFAEDMWRRNGKVGFRVYDAEMAKEYVGREARPKDRSFLDAISLFCSSSKT